jgi:hypothetical protein
MISNEKILKYKVVDLVQSISSLSLYEFIQKNYDFLTQTNPYHRLIWRLEVLQYARWVLFTTSPYDTVVGDFNRRI